MGRGIESRQRIRKGGNLKKFHPIGVVLFSFSHYNYNYKLQFFLLAMLGVVFFLA
jgi:hypothetical protein